MVSKPAVARAYFAWGLADDFSSRAGELIALAFAGEEARRRLEAARAPHPASLVVPS
jgi:hypothetical protein